MTAYPMGLSQDQPTDALRLARRLLRGAAGAEDLVQEAELSLLRRDHRDAEHRRASLALTLRHLADRTLRGARHRGDRERAAARPEAVADPEAAVLRAEDRRLVRDALAALSPQSRATLVDLYFEERSTREVAARESLTQRAVQKREKAALEELRAALSRRQGGERIWLSVFAPALPARVRGWTQVAAPASRHTAAAAVGMVVLSATALVLLRDGAPPVVVAQPELVGVATDTAGPALVTAMAAAAGDGRITAEPVVPRSVLCMEGASERPVPGARVTVWSGTGHDTPTVELVEGWLEAGVFDGRLGRPSGTVEADPAGAVTLDLPPRPTLLTATDGTRWGWALVDGTTAAPIRMELFPDGPLEVSMVDAADRPARGAPVSFAGLGYYGDDLVGGVTDHDGRMTLPHAVYLGNRARSRTPSFLGLDAYDATSEGSFELEDGPFDLDRSPPAVTLRHQERLWDVEIRLAHGVEGTPWKGPLELTVWERDPITVTGSTILTSGDKGLSALRLTPSDESLAVLSVGIGDGPEALHATRGAPRGKGSRAFDWSDRRGVGLRVEADAAILDRGERRLLVTLGIGPAEVPEPSSLPSSLSGRLVDPSGVPLARYPMKLTLDGSVAGHPGTTTGDDGRFTLRFWAPSQYAYGVAVALETGHPFETCASDLPVVPGGDLDVGDLVCTVGVEPQSLRGVVRTPAGEPAEGARVRWLGGGEGVAHATTDGEGRFSFLLHNVPEERGTDPDLEVDHPDWAPLRHRAGDLDAPLDLTLEAPLSVAGTVLARFPHEAGSLWVEAAFRDGDLDWLEVDDGGLPPVGLVRAPVLEDGTFLLRGVAPAEYRLRVTHYLLDSNFYMSASTLVLHAQGIDLRRASGRTRLETIDLDATVHEGTIELVDVHGAALEGIENVLLSAPPDCARSWGDVGPTLRVIAPPGSTVEASDDRFYPHEPVPFGSTCRVVLRARDRVEVRIEGGLPGLGEDLEYELEARCGERPEQELELVAGERASFLALDLAPHTFVLSVTDYSETFEVHRWTDLPLTEGAAVVLEAPPAAAIQDALGALREAALDAEDGDDD